MDKRPTNQGEGNPGAARNFNSAEQAFVGSPQGKQKIDAGTHVRPEEENELAKAEKAGRDRAKTEDAR
jgi:hypothetical protein